MQVANLAKRVNKTFGEGSVLYEERDEKDIDLPRRRDTRANDENSITNNVQDRVVSWLAIICEVAARGTEFKGSSIPSSGVITMTSPCLPRRGDRCPDVM